MAHIIGGDNCGNSPKSLFLKQFNIDFAEGNVEALLASVTDDIVWRMVAEGKVIEGIGHFTAVTQKLAAHPAQRLTFDQIITHGKAGSVNGELTAADGKTYAFCDVYTFRNTKGDQIKSITSYLFEVGTHG